MGFYLKEYSNRIEMNSRDEKLIIVSGKKRLPIPEFTCKHIRIYSSYGEPLNDNK